MLLGGRPLHLLVLGVMGAYAGLGAYYATVARLPHPVVYAALPLGEHAGGGAPDWEAFNATAIYVGPNETGALSPELRDRARVVYARRDCRAYLWDVHFRLAALAWLLYAAFVYARQERRMFGPFRDPAEFLAPEKYTLNYAASVLAATVIGCSYTKFAWYMAELATRRAALSRDLREDPITLAHRHPTLIALILLEIGLRLGARMALFTTLGVTRAPCALVFPLYARALVWLFVLAVGALELLAATLPHIARVSGATAPPARADGGRAALGVCGACCSTVLAGIFAKALYLLLLVGGVLLFLHYERHITIFG
ncbi:gK [Suid alphaherpesvirus 1]|nr:gK [Suid alphaherpesvirus 1]